MWQVKNSAPNAPRATRRAAPAPRQAGSPAPGYGQNKAPKEALVAVATGGEGPAKGMGHLLQQTLQDPARREV